VMRNRIKPERGGPPLAIGLCQVIYDCIHTFMSLIHTCELSDADPFDYLTELLRHRDELKRAPQDWMPWNYRRAIDRSVLPPVPLGDDPPT